MAIPSCTPESIVRRCSIMGEIHVIGCDSARRHAADVTGDHSEVDALELVGPLKDHGGPVRR